MRSSNAYVFVLTVLLALPTALVAQTTTTSLLGSTSTSTTVFGAITSTTLQTITTTTVGKVAIGFARLGTKSKLAEQQMLAITLPLSWAQIYSSDKSRLVRPEEQKEELLKSLRSKIIIAETALSNELRSRDDKWFTSTLDASGIDKHQTARELALKNIALAKAEYEQGKNLDLSEVNYYQLQVLSASDEGLHAAVDDDNSPEGISRRAKLKMLVWGNLVDLGGYLFLELHLFHAGLGREIWRQDLALLGENSNLWAQKTALEMADALLAYHGASVELNPSPEDARLTLTHRESGLQRFGQGKTMWHYLAPGSYSVRMTRAGKLDRTIDLSVAEGQTVTLVPEMLDRLGSTMRIQTSPPNASIYDGASFVGFSPMDYDLQNSGNVISVRLDGYEPLYITKEELTARLEQNAPGLPVSPIVLHRKVFDWNDEVQIRRDQLYDSLGLSFLSFIPAFVFNNLYLNVRSTLQSQSDLSANPSLVADGNFYLSLYPAFYFLGFTILGDALLIRLPNYLNAVESASGR